jgi:hypothetical protein
MNVTLCSLLGRDDATVCSGFPPFAAPGASTWSAVRLRKGISESVCFGFAQYNFARFRIQEKIAIHDRDMGPYKEAARPLSVRARHATDGPFEWIHVAVIGS